MPFCSNCGNQIEDNDVFCQGCGTKVPSNQTSEYGNAQNSDIPYSNYSPVSQPTQAPNVVYVEKQKPKIPGRGFGITSMVLGIIGDIYAVEVLSTAFSESGNYNFYIQSAVDTTIISLIVFALILCILSLIFGLCAFGRKFKKGQSISGVIMGSLGIVLSIVSIIAVSLS